MAFVLAAMIVLAVGVGVASMFLGQSGDDDAAPSAQTNDGRVVVMEFSDYG